MIVVRTEYAMYPFLDNEPTPMDRLVSVDFYREARCEGVKRIADAMENGQVAYGYHTGEAGYQYAKILLSCVNDRELTKRYALSEATAMVRLLNDECPRTYQWVADCLGADMELSVFELGMALQMKIETEIPMEIPDNIASAVSKDVDTVSKMLYFARMKGMV